MTALKAEELRIGNLINYDYDGKVIPLTVDYIGKDLDGYVGYFVGLNNEQGNLVATCLVDGDFTTPIPLTEDWLLKFGLEYRNDRRGKGAIMDMKPHNKDEYWKSPSIGIGKDRLIYMTAWNAHIQYVHQLQNLFFALTHTELTIIESNSLTVETKKG